MPPVLRCRTCGEWYQVVHVVPDICPHCQNSAVWTTEGDPAKPYQLTVNDKKFLRSLRITAD